MYPVGLLKRHWWVHLQDLFSLLYKLRPTLGNEELLDTIQAFVVVVKGFIPHGPCPHASGRLFYQTCDSHVARLTGDGGGGDSVLIQTCNSWVLVWVHLFFVSLFSRRRDKPPEKSSVGWCTFTGTIYKNQQCCCRWEYIHTLHAQGRGDHGLAPYLLAHDSFGFLEWSVYIL